MVAWPLDLADGPSYSQLPGKYALYPPSPNGEFLDPVNWRILLSKVKSISQQQLDAVLEYLY